MTICRAAAGNNKFNGHSSDEKPADMPEGAELHTVDTGEEFIYHNGMWVQDLRRINAIKMAAL